MKKRAFIIAVALVGLVASGVLGFEVWLRHSIRRAVENALDGTGAEVTFGRVAVSLIRRSVTVHDVRVLAQNNDIAHRGFTVVSLDLALPRIAVRGLRYRMEDGRPALSASRLVVENVRTTLVTRNVGDKHGGPDSDSLAQTDPSSVSRPLNNFRETLLEKLASLSVDEIAVNGATFEWVRWLSDNESARLTLGGGDISMRDITLDSLPADIRLSVDSIVHGFGSGAKVLRADSVVLDATAGRLTLAGFALVPQFGKDEFAVRVKNHEDWTAISIGGIACKGLDFERLLSKRTLVVDSVSIASAEISSYKNRKVFSPPRTKQMLYETIRRLPVPFEIGTLNFDNLDITYDELSDGGTVPGTVIFTGGRGTATGITNIAGPGRRFMTVDLDATFMRSAALHAKFLFPVSATDDHWELTGRLGAIDMSAFNRALEPLVNVRITSGVLQSLDFHITGTLARSRSNVTMKYNDLQVAFLDRHDHTRTRKFLTFLADDLLIRPDNPGHNNRGRLRTGEGDHAHDPERSMWNYIWRSLLPAILKTVI